MAIATLRDFILITLPCYAEWYSMVASANVETRGQFRLPSLSSEMLTLKRQVQTLSEPRNPLAA